MEPHYDYDPDALAYFLDDEEDKMDEKKHDFLEEYHQDPAAYVGRIQIRMDAEC